MANANFNIDVAKDLHLIYTKNRCYGKAKFIEEAKVDSEFDSIEKSMDKETKSLMEKGGLA